MKKLLLKFPSFVVVAVVCVSFWKDRLFICTLSCVCIFSVTLQSFDFTYYYYYYYYFFYYGFIRFYSSVFFFILFLCAHPHFIAVHPQSAVVILPLTKGRIFILFHFWFNSCFAQYGIEATNQTKSLNIFLVRKRKLQPNSLFTRWTNSRDKKLVLAQLLIRTYKFSFQSDFFSIRRFDNIKMPFLVIFAQPLCPVVGIFEILFGVFVVVCVFIICIFMFEIVWQTAVATTASQRIYKIIYVDARIDNIFHIGNMQLTI